MSMRLFCDHCKEEIEDRWGDRSEISHGELSADLHKKCFHLWVVQHIKLPRRLKLSYVASKMAKKKD